jgi:hypothetical protein
MPNVVANKIFTHDFEEAFEDTQNIYGNFELYGVSPYFLNNFGESIFTLYIYIAAGWVFMLIYIYLRKKVKNAFATKILIKLKNAYFWGIPMNNFMSIFMDFVFYIFTSFTLSTNHSPQG